MQFPHIFVTTRDGHDYKLSHRDSTYPLHVQPLARSIQAIGQREGASSLAMNRAMSELLATSRRNQEPHAPDAEIVSVRVVIEKKRLAPPLDDRLYVPDTIDIVARAPSLAHEASR